MSVLKEQLEQKFFKEYLDEKSFSTVVKNKNNVGLYIESTSTRREVVGDPIFHFVNIHGLFSNHKFNTKLKNYLLNSYSTKTIFSSFDLAGHGLSGGNRGEITSFEGFCEDLSLVLNTLKNILDLKNNIQTILIGQDLGAIIILKTIVDQYLDKFNWPVGLILSNPLFSIRKDSILKPTLKKNILSFFNRPFELEGSKLSSDKKISLLYETDPLVVKSYTHSSLIKILEAASDIRVMSYFLDIPTLFLVSDSKYICDRHSTSLFAKGMPEDLAKLVSISQTKHDIFNCDNPIVFDHISNWVKDKLYEHNLKSNFN